MSLIDNFLEMLAAERASALNTLSAYKLDLDNLSDFLNHSSLESASLNDLRGYIQYLNKQGYSTRSINRKISSIKQFYQFLASEDLISENPSIELDLQKQSKTLPKNKVFIYLFSTQITNRANYRYANTLAFYLEFSK